MIAYLIDKGDYYICNICRMRLYNLKDKCPFCNNLFSNYEELVIKNLMEIENDNNRS